MIDAPFVRSIGIMVVAAVLVALGARALRLPTIVAYLVAGLLLGPLTGLMEATEAIHLVAEAGIVLLLFLVGLELSFAKIRGVGPTALLAGSAQILLTAAGGTGLAHLLGFPLVPSLILGVALTFSSTVIVVKLLVDSEDTDKPHGRIAIGILLVQDLFVVILLTLVSGLAEGGSLDAGVVATGLGKAFGGMILLLAAVLAAAKWLLPRPFIWAAGSPETLFIWSLCWCFLVVSATHVLHLSPEIGAFVAGVSLAQLPYHRDLQRRVQPLMNFFIAVFFVSLGLELELDVASVFWARATALSVFVVVGKFLIIMFIVSRLRYSERTAFFAALFLTQISEFSFIFIALVAGAGFVGAEARVLIGLVGLLSITISTIAIVFREFLYRSMSRLGLLGVFRATGSRDRDAAGRSEWHDHIIIVGMNALGRELASRLHERGEKVLAIDLDPGKLQRVEVETLLGNAESAALLREAGLEKAKLLVSALHAELANNLLAFRCRQAGTPCSIHAVDLNALDQLLAMDVRYIIVPKADGLLRQQQELERLGLLKS